MREAALRRIAVGFFDGVHLGHRSILSGADAALTFNPHPLAVVDPDRQPRLLMSLEERVAAIREAGVGEVIVLDFTPGFSRMTAPEFLDFMMAREFSRFGTVRCGANWRFGAGGTGDWRLLAGRGLNVELVDYVEFGGERISSSRIRDALAAGMLEDASAMLGGAFRKRLKPVSGKGLGSSLGYPTVNFEVELPLPGGVFAVRLDGFRAIANYGFAPTAGENAWRRRTLEVHQLEGEVSLSPSMEVSFLSFIRPERKFLSFEELRRQIEIDCGKVLQ